MVNSTQKILSILSLFGTCFTFIVMGLGTFTRLIDAGLGCPDWPGCYGHLTVPNEGSALQIHYPETPLIAYKAWGEMIHRYFAGSLGVLIIGIVITVLLCARHEQGSKRASPLERRFLYGIAIWLCLLIAYQIMLGKWTVTLKLLPIVVTQHLLGGLLILSTLWSIHWFTTRHLPDDTPSIPRGFQDATRCSHNRATQCTKQSMSSEASEQQSRSLKGNGYIDPASGPLIPWARLGVALLFVQIILGAWTSTNYASFSCPDFPFCTASNWFPLTSNFASPETTHQTIQMFHRVGALVIFFYWFSLCATVLSRGLVPLFNPVFLILFLLILQIALGIANVIFQLPLPIAIAHQLTAALLFLTTLTFIFKISYFVRCS